MLAYLGTHAARLKSLDPAVRRDEPDPVHQMRVTARRPSARLRLWQLSEQLTGSSVPFP